MKWLRRFVLLAPAAGSLVIGWQNMDSAFFATLSILGAILWTWTGVRRIKEVESE